MLFARFVTALLLAGSLAAPALAENVTIPATATSPAITGYLSRPAGTAPAGAVLLLHGCEGFTSFMSTSADALAAQGYVALAIDMYKPQGVANGCADVSHTAHVAADYAVSAVTWLQAQTYVNGKVGLIGYSAGGLVALDLVDPNSPVIPLPSGLKAAVAFYPFCRGRGANVQVPLQIFDGDADDWAPPASCQALVQSATAASQSAAITTYPGASHAFNVPRDGTKTFNGHTLRFDPNATAQANAAMLAFFARYLK